MAVNNLNDMAAQANSRIPPSWGPEHERSYPYRFYEADVQLLSSATDIEQQRQGATVVLRLTGAARNLCREMPTGVLANGRQDRDLATGQPMFDQVTGLPIMLTGVEVILSALRARYGQLPQEVQISSVSDLMVFCRAAHEDTDQVMARFEVTLHRAQNLGGVALSEPIKAWMLMTHLRLPRDKWPTMLAPFNGRLPINDPEYIQFLAYLRRNGHLFDSKFSDAGKTIMQPYFQADSMPYSGMPGADGAPDWAGLAGADYSSQLPFDPWQHAYQAHAAAGAGSNDDTMSVSSCWSMESADMDWSDFVNADTSTAEGYNSLAEGLYLSYRHAKRKWRTFSGPRRKRKGKGKGKSNGKRKGHHGQAYWVDEANDESDPWSAFFKGGEGGGKQGGKRPFVRTGNPVDSSGVQLKCSICDSTAHFRANCPQNKSG